MCWILSNIRNQLHRFTRRQIIFSRYNLINDPPISKIDLLVYRNVSIYFNIEAQTRALASFHFSLKDSGFLLLGALDMMPTCTNFFTPAHIKQHVYTKVAKSNLNQRLLHRAISPRQLGGRSLWCFWATRGKAQCYLSIDVNEIIFSYPNRRGG